MPLAVPRRGAWWGCGPRIRSALLDQSSIRNRLAGLTLYCCEQTLLLRCGAWLSITWEAMSSQDPLAMFTCVQMPRSRRRQPRVLQRRRALPDLLSLQRLRKISPLALVSRTVGVTIKCSNGKFLWGGGPAPLNTVGCCCCSGFCLLRGSALELVVVVGMRWSSARTAEKQRACDSSL